MRACGRCPSCLLNQTGSHGLHFCCLANCIRCAHLCTAVCDCHCQADTKVVSSHSAVMCHFLSCHRHHPPSLHRTRRRPRPRHRREERLCGEWLEEAQETVAAGRPDLAIEERASCAKMDS